VYGVAGEAKGFSFLFRFTLKSIEYRKTIDLEGFENGSSSSTPAQFKNCIQKPLFFQRRRACCVVIVFGVC
jgi:hypothetical protein